MPQGGRDDRAGGRCRVNANERAQHLRPDRDRKLSFCGNCRWIVASLREVAGLSESRRRRRKNARLKRQDSNSQEERNENPVDFTFSELRYDDQLGPVGAICVGPQQQRCFGDH